MQLVGTRHVNLHGNCACKALQNTEFFSRNRKCFAVKSKEIFRVCLKFAHLGRFCILSCRGAAPPISDPPEALFTSVR